MVDASHVLVDCDEEEAQENLWRAGVSKVFFEGSCGTGGMIRGLPAKGSVSDKVSKDSRHSSRWGESTGVGGPVESTLERADSEGLYVKGVGFEEDDKRAGGGSCMAGEGRCFFNFFKPMAEANE